MVAIKAFRLDLLPEDVARLADALRRLVGTGGHIAAGLEGMTAYLAMEYYAAETLDVALRHLAPAPMDAALPILRAIADSIDSAWAAGPMHGHGSLHPRDVFVTPGTNDVSITGWGVAPALEAIGSRAPVRRPYTAPERATGGEWDVRADVYSLGAIAHELLTGRRPAGPGEQDGSLPAAMGPEVRVQIRRVLSKALAESPSKRFSTAAEFVDALADPSTVPEPEPAPPPVNVAALPLTIPAPPEAQAIDSMVSPIEPPVEAPIEPAAEAPIETPMDIPAPIATRASAPAPTPVPPRRTRVSAPASRAPRAATPTPAEPVINIGDAPLRPADESPMRLDPPPSVGTPQMSLPLPPRYPWVAMVAAILASLVLGWVGGFQYGRQWSPAPVAAPPPPAESTSSTAKPAAPAASDTEVKVGEPPARPAAAAGGRIIIRTVPAGAAVAVDGKSAGHAPLTLSDLTLATHSVAASHPGFESETRRVTLTAAVPSATLQMTLKSERSERPAPAAKASATGGVNVDSRPKGARVTIDGRSIGVTPLSVPGLKPGSHTVRVELTGYKTVTSTVVVKAGEMVKLTLSLEQR